MSTQINVHAHKDSSTRSYGHRATIFFFFNDTATTEIYTLSLHDALPISQFCEPARAEPICTPEPEARAADRKSTRLNSSHLVISYAVFCLKKKKRKVMISVVWLSCSQEITSTLTLLAMITCIIPSYICAC